VLIYQWAACPPEILPFPVEIRTKLVNPALEEQVLCHCQKTTELLSKQ
jgi:hypothetical protein